jgi:hypothetical protein
MGAVSVRSLLHVVAEKPVLQTILTCISHTPTVEGEGLKARI